VESLGARFRQERERKGMTLDDVAVATKIGTRMLQALEEERYDQLPGGIFNKGFVRAYARHLGLDEEKAVADYVAATGPPPVEAQPVAVMEAMAAHAVETRGERLSPLDRFPWGKLSILLLLVAIVLTIWGPRPRGGEKRKQESAPHSGVAAPAPNSAPPKEARAVAVVVPAVFLAATPRVPAPGAKAAAPAPVLGAFSLRIQANEDSWVTITADGKQVFQALLPAHTQKSLEANRGIVVKAGNVGGLDFWFNGSKLPPQGDLDQVRTLTFAPSGLQPPAARTTTPPATNP
jgi:cytoskeleton protein RodZ